MSLENLYNIQIRSFAVGNDYLFVITGGTAHVGATATAYWNNDRLMVSLTELPHHKEGELAKECAQLATDKLHCTCTVVMGIHINDATKEDIKNIVSYVRDEMSNTINKI